MEIHTDKGKLVISSELLAALAGNAALEVRGVAGMAPRKLREGLADLLGRENYGRGVVIRWEGDCLAVEVYLVVKFGENIMPLAAKVAEAVSRSLKEHTGSTVGKVDVVVRGVRKEGGGKGMGSGG